MKQECCHIGKLSLITLNLVDLSDHDKPVATSRIPTYDITGCMKSFLVNMSLEINTRPSRPLLGQRAPVIGEKPPCLVRVVTA